VFVPSAESPPYLTTATDNWGEPLRAGRRRCQAPRFVSGPLRGRPGDHGVKRANPWSRRPPVKSRYLTASAPAPGPTHRNWPDWRFYAFLLDLLRIPGTFLFLPLTFPYRRLQPRCTSCSNQDSALYHRPGLLLSIKHPPRFQSSAVNLKGLAVSAPIGFPIGGSCQHR
jgi:hypothetical protein